MLNGCKLKDWLCGSFAFRLLSFKEVEVVFSLLNNLQGPAAGKLMLFFGWWHRKVCFISILINVWLGCQSKMVSFQERLTGICSNHAGISFLLSALQCDHSHQHKQLQNGLPHLARIYPDTMIELILKGITLNRVSSAKVFLGEDDSEENEEGGDLEEMLDQEVESAGRPLSSPQEVNLTEEQKRKINLVHVNMGHISVSQMLSLFKAAGAKPEVMRFIKHRFNCEQCQKQNKPLERKRATMPRTFSFNRILGIDYFFIPFQGKTLAYLNTICHGTNLQQVGRLKDYEHGSPSSLATWRLFSELWVKPFGLPEVLISDGGSEFRAAFERSLEQTGVLQITSDASSPWQNGKVERHGGWVKSRVEAEISSGHSVLNSIEDLDDIISSMITHKNRWFSHGGFSPAQLAFGVNPRIPADLLAEDPLQSPGWDDILSDPYDQDTPAAEFSRAHTIRQRARELCVSQVSKDKIRLSGKGRRHPQRTWAIGQWVFVWRRAPGIPAGHVTRSRWTGPGLVVLQQGHTVWVSMRSRLLKCNSDQVRPATHFEEIGADLSQSQELKDLLSQVQSGRAGAVDVSREGSPTDEEFQEPIPAGQDASLEVPQSASNTLESIPEEGPLADVAPGRGHLLRPDLHHPTGSPEVAAPQTPSSLPLRRESVGEPEPTPSVAESEESKRRKIETSSVSSRSSRAEALERKRPSELKTLERLAVKELRRLEREEKASSSASGAAAVSSTPAIQGGSLGDNAVTASAGVRSEDVLDEDDPDLLVGSFFLHDNSCHGELSLEQNGESFLLQTSQGEECGI